MFGNCALPELWGKRVQPWMQTLHAFFGIGAIVGPASVGFLGYQATFTIIAIGSFFPIASLLLYGFFVRKCASTGGNSFVAVDDKDDLEAVDKTEATTASLINVPILLKIVISLFYFIYVGTETGFSGWISIYALDEGITNSSSKAAYLSAMFWAAITVGRILAIPIAICFSATAMLRFQLVLSCIGSFAGIVFLGVNYFDASVICTFMGFALSTMFPLMMTILSDYGFNMYDFPPTYHYLVFDTIIYLCIN